MLDERIYESYIGILKEEMVPAMGCTEPIALAYGAARAREVLGKEPEHITAKCSGNIIKNVRCVIIPNSGGLTGIRSRCSPWCSSRRPIIEYGSSFEGK